MWGCSQNSDKAVLSSDYFRRQMLNTVSRKYVILLPMIYIRSLCFLFIIHLYQSFAYAILKWG